MASSQSRNSDALKYLFHPPNIAVSDTVAVFATDTVDDRSILSSLQGPLVAGTCTWIVEHPQFLRWQTDEPLLWLSGAPGKGKTALARYLTEQLDRSNTIFYFCENDGRRDTIGAILRGLIYQLVRLRPELFSLIKLDYKAQGNRIFLSMHTMWRMLSQMAEDCERLFCIIDNLDGCKDASLPEFLGLCKNSPPELRVLVTSRAMSGDIVRQLHGVPRIDLDADDEDIADDTGKYVRQRARSLAESQGYTTQLGKDIERTLLSATEDTFLWASAMIAELERQPVREAPAVLRSIPPALQTVYDNMLQSIDPLDSSILERIFSWVVVAFRPLTTEEIAIAVGLESSSLVREYVKRSRQFIRIVNERVGFIHQSAKDYLRHPSAGNRYGCDLEKAHLEAATKCYNFVISHEIFRGRSRPEILEDPNQIRTFPFLEYATIFWSEHSRLASKDVKDVFDLSDPFCCEVSPVRDKWLRTYTAFLETAASGGFTLLHVAALVDLVPLARKVIRSERWKLAKSLNKKSHSDATPLYVASKLGHEQMVDLLISEGADINAQGGQLGFPLQAAAFSGHASVTRSLLAAGANPNLSGGFYGTALQAAAKRDAPSIVKMLINAKADVNSNGGLYGTALQGAVWSQNQEIIRLLLKAGADPNATGGAPESPLSAAVKLKDVAIAQILRDWGAKGPLL